ncbi:MAG TPA: nuclease-related domain-containing protein [Trichormus sp.]
MKRKYTPRDMAFDRRARAVGCWAGAGLLVLIAVIVLFRMPLSHSLWIACALLAGARILQSNGAQSMIAAKRADTGAEGEDQVAKVLHMLNNDWQVRRNFFAEYLGDIDFVLQSPTGRCFTLEVKAHKGTILSDYEGIFRRIGSKMLPFEKNLLHTANDQAAYVRKELSCTDVVPVLVFTRAEIRTTSRCLEGVHLVTDAQLIKFLDEQTQPPQRKAKAAARAGGTKRRSFSGRK